MCIFLAYSIMDIKVARRVSERPVFDRLGGGQHYVKNQICSYWLAGRCNRNPCRFLHLDEANPQPQPQPPKRSPINCVKSTWRNPNYASSKNVTASSSDDQSVIKSKSTWRNPEYMSSKNVTVSSSVRVGSGCRNGIEKEILTTKGAEPEPLGQSIEKAQPKVCQYWLTGNCVQGDKCRDLHSWFSGSGFSLLAKLEGHSKAVNGVALPSGSNKLLSGSKDESVRIWDCHSGQCVNTVKLDSEIGCMTSEGPWVFVGLKNSVKVWNFNTQTELVLNGPNGLVNAMAVDNDNTLFAGVEDGSILAWKISSEFSCTEVVATLKGHSSAVISLVVGANRLYSGSKDNTIRVWDVKTLKCLHTLNGHTNSVTAVICWDRYLLSGSLDNTLKVWGEAAYGNLEVVFEVKEGSGVVAFCGIHDAEEKPILLCSCKDNAVRLYDLPSFVERGRIFAKREVQTVAIGCGGLFFTGDATGRVFVWRLDGKSGAAAS